MTLKQVLDFIWHRRLLAGLTMLLVLSSSVLYLLLVPAEYLSTATVRYGTLATQMFDGGTGYPEVDLDLDINTTSSRVVIDPAAALLGEDGDSLQSSLTVQLIEGIRNNRIVIGTTGSSPEHAQARADTVAQVYVDYLQGQVDDGVDRVNEDLASAREERDLYSTQLRGNPDDPVAVMEFQNAATRVGGLEATLSTLVDAGPPATVYVTALPGEATGPGMLTVLAIGLAAGLLAGFGVALIREQFDDRIYGASQAESATNESVLAEIPRLRHRELAARPLLVASPQPSPFTEAIRTLRTSLLTVVPARPVAFAVTSPGPGEGKSLLAANLALSFALGGRSVIVVDADRHRPALAGIFNVPADAAGLTEAMHDPDDTEQVSRLLLDSGHESLRVLPPGQDGGESTDLLAGDAFAHVVSHLRSLAEVVVIDTPPARVFADAAIIGGRTDGTLVVLSIGSTRRRALASTVRSLRRAGVTIAGLAVNRSRHSSQPSHRSYSAYTRRPARPDEAPAEGPQ